MEIELSIKEKCFNEYISEIDSLFDENMISNCFKNNFNKIKDSIYLVYPFYFATYFEGIEERKLFDLALCGNLYFSYLLMLDAFIDNEADGASLIALHAIHEKAIIKLTELFNTDSLFWNYFKLYSNSYFLGIEKEINLLKNKKMYSYSLFKEITKAQCSFAKCSTSGLLVMSKIISDDDPFIKTQDEFHIGLQILDDIKDWKADYKNNKSSWLLSVILSDKSFYDKLDKTNDKVNTIGKYIYLTDLGTNQIKKAILHFKKAKKLCASYNIPAWVNLIEKHILKCEVLIQDFIFNKNFVIHQKISKEKHIINKYSSKDDYDKAPYLTSLKKGIAYLLVERKNNYNEANHAMRLPSSEKRDSGYGKIVVGNLFQRTLLVETFLDINLIIPNLIEKNIIYEDIDIIINLRMKPSLMGWNYFPGYKFLPPDTDDLAQVIHILSKSSYPNTHKYIDDIIEILIKYNKNSDDTFKTWIIDPHDDSEHQKKLKLAIKNYWGDYKGRDIEVTANFLYSLSLYNPNKFKKIIFNGLSAILSAQSTKGCWDSIWYWDSFYGTYISVRLLVKMKVKKRYLENAKKFILTTQNTDGGWGFNNSNPLNTSLALLTLASLKTNNIAFPKEVLNKGLLYLINEQDQFGSWEKSPFIRMRMGAKDNSYGSVTVTTSFVVRALAQFLKFS